MKRCFLTENERYELNRLFDKIEELHKEEDPAKREERIDELNAHMKRLKGTINLEFDPLEKVKKYDFMAQARSIFGK